MSGLARIPRVLSIAGTDPTGGAGIQADLKSIAANGGYGMAVVTALVAQNTHGVRSVHVPPVSFLTEQLNAVSDDVDIDAVKIGMLATTEVVEGVQRWLERVAPGSVVLDPVMLAASGDRLLDQDAEQALRELAQRVDVLTPNILELALLAGEPVARSWQEVVEQAKRVCARYQVRVLAKGGHLRGQSLPDALVDPTGASIEVTEFPGVRIATTNTHGTGCSLSSALATRHASSGDWVVAAAESKRWLLESIRNGGQLQVGTGCGPVSHFAGLWARGGVVTRPTPEEVAQDWWDHIRDIREAIDELPFIRTLGEGTLSRSVFLWYLAQDAHYLRDYMRVLGEASRLAPTVEEQTLWAGASGSIVAELDMLETWIPAEIGRSVSASPTTTAYVNHLLAAAARGNYPVLIAAALPCFWLYHDVGTRLYSHSRAEHPYRYWLETYGDEGFAASAQRALSTVTRVAALAGEGTRGQMRQAFRVSAAHEFAFFAAPLADE